MSVVVDVAFALPDRQRVVQVTLKQGSLVREAILKSGLLTSEPGLLLDTLKVGVFGRRAALDDEVHDGDRVEIYRPLVADPKEVRRQRAGQRPRR